jgi:hypothetical protein
MTATNHGLFGAAIAVTLSSNPVVAIAIAPFSHFLLDAIPHFPDENIDLHGKRFFRILKSDALLAVFTTLIVAFVWSEIWWLVILCSFLAASPDLMWIYYEYIDKTGKRHRDWLPRFHSWIQWSQTDRGINFEVLWYLVFFCSLMYLGVNQ